MVVAAFIAATLTTVAQPTSADQITDQIHNDQQQQAQVQAELATLRAKIAAAQNQEGELTAIISGLDAQIAATQARVTQSLAQVAAIGVELTAARSRLDVSRARLAMEKEQLAGELVTIYELANESTPLSNLLASGDFNQFWTDLIDSRRISDHELQTVDVIHAQQDQIQA